MFNIHSSSSNSSYSFFITEWLCKGFLINLSYGLKIWLLLTQHISFQSLVAATTLLQQYLTTGKDPSSKIFMFIFPILIGYWALSFPTAISIYWIFYSIFSTIEFILVNRRYAKALEVIKK